MRNIFYLKISIIFYYFNFKTESRACRTMNVATIEKGAKVIEGFPDCYPDSLSASEVLFNREINSDQCVYQSGENRITIQLGRPYFLESLGSSLYFLDSFD
jgi:hypothetical protein